MNADVQRRVIPTPDGVRLKMHDVIRSDLEERKITDPTKLQYYKFSIDGATVSNDRKITQVIAALEVLDFAATGQSSSPYSMLPVAISLCNEKYHELETNFKEVFDELATLHDAQIPVSVDGTLVKIPICILVTIDLPLLLILLGFGKNFYNNSGHCCWRCKVKGTHRAGATENDVELRTLEELLQGPLGTHACGLKRQPLLRVPLEKIIACELHFDVAIVRRLMELLADEVDGQVEDGTMAPTEEEKFAQELAKIVGVRILDKKWEGKVRKMKERVSSFWLTHVRAKKILKNWQTLVDIVETNWTNPQRPKFSKAWSLWNECYTLLQLPQLSTGQQEEYHRKFDEFCKTIQKSCSDAALTPYMHHGRVHIPESLKKYGSIIQFSNRTLEALHAINKKILATKSSKFKNFLSCKRNIALKQLQTFSRLHVHLLQFDMRPATSLYFLVSVLHSSFEYTSKKQFFCDTCTENYQDRLVAVATNYIQMSLDHWKKHEIDTLLKAIVLEFVVFAICSLASSFFCVCEFESMITHGFVPLGMEVLFVGYLVISCGCTWISRRIGRGQ